MTPRVKRLRPVDYENVEGQVVELFRALLFAPLMRIAAVPEKPAARAVLRNAGENDLVAAIESGRIHLDGGTFSGSFSAAISSALRKVGATFDARTRVYRMDAGKVPPAVRAAATMFSTKSAAAHRRMTLALDETQLHLDTILDRAKIRFDPTIARTIADFRDVASLIGVSPVLSDGEKRRIEDDYNRSTKLPIRRFLDSEISELRSRVEANAIAGGRFEGLTGMIKERYGVAERKARFLARQETALFTSKYHEQRFAEAGVQKYVWSTSHDERVRPAAGVTGKARLNDHRDLDGREFFFSNPPVVDRATMRRANPGEDYNCRCVPIPVLPKSARA